MPLLLYNTLVHRKQKFVPLNKNIVGLYTCGPTVYNYAHIGNLRSFIFEDILKRVLLFNNFEVNHVMNITDVGHLTSDADEGEDKMTQGLHREGLPITLEGMKKLAARYTAAFITDLKKLNIILPSVMPLASEHISEDVKMIQSLQAKNFTYKTADGIYFDTSKLKDYRKLLKHQPDEEPLARIKTVSGKKHLQDFALWKLNPNLGWSVPLGKGFPGWHIECSVMASKYLGKQFDLHCGGKEHIPIHHTNEIAQSEAAFGQKPWVKYWLHNEWLVLAGGEKMAKSGENFITLSTLEKKGFSPIDYRYFCLGTNYRNPLMFSYGALESAKKSRRKLFEAALALRESTDNIHKNLQKKYLTKFKAEVNDDLNTPRALATLWEVLKDQELSKRDKYLLLLQFDRVFGLNLGAVNSEKIPSLILKLAKERELARKNQDWKKSDQLREQIRQKGYIIEDSSEGFSIKKK